MKRILICVISLFIIFSSPVFAQDLSVSGNHNFSSEELNARFTTGDLHSAYIDNFHNLWTWGFNNYGELFQGDRNAPSYTFPAKSISDVIQVSCGDGSTAVITSDGTLLTVGDNHYGQLGNGDSGPYKFTAAVPNRILENVKQVSMGDSHGAAVTNNNELYTWGLNNFGQLGKGNDSEDTSNLTPKKVMDNVSSVVCGYRNTAIITTDGSLYMCGANFYNRLGDGTLTNHFSPVKIMDNVKSVSLEISHSAAVTNNGELFMWGSNSEYELGIGSTDGKSVSKPVKVMDGVKEVALGQQFTVVLKNDGTVLSFGNNNQGCTGVLVENESPYYVKTPTKILDNVIHISAKNFHGMAVKADGSLWYWGQPLGTSYNFEDKYNGSHSPYRLIEGFKPYTQAVPEPTEGTKCKVSINIEPNKSHYYVYGNGVYDYHKTVHLYRSSTSNFEGWYDGDTLVSKEEDYYFVVTHDTNLTCRFEPIQAEIHPKVEGIKLDQHELNLNLGETKQLNVTFVPENAYNKNLTWTSSNPSVISVVNGKIKAQNEGNATIIVTSEDGGFKDSCLVNVVNDKPSIVYETHIENIGWGNFGQDGTSSGTTGRCLRLEGIKINLNTSKNLGVAYKTHVEDYGWMNTVHTGEMSGTQGQAKRLEAIMIGLDGADSYLYDIYYRVHAQDVGWMNWTKNYDMAGTAGFARRLEAIQIVIVPKGDQPPVPNPPNNVNEAFLQR